MKFISHRGNTQSTNLNEENNPNYIEKAIELGFEVEIDLRVHNNNLYLGHDKNQYSKAVRNADRSRGMRIVWGAGGRTALANQHRVF